MLSLHLERIRPFRDRPYLGNHKIPKAASVVAIVAEPVAYKAIALIVTFSFAVGEIQPGWTWHSGYTDHRKHVCGAFQSKMRHLFGVISIVCGIDLRNSLHHLCILNVASTTRNFLLSGGCRCPNSLR